MARSALAYDDDDDESFPGPRALSRRERAAWRPPEHGKFSGSRSIAASDGRPLRERGPQGPGTGDSPFPPRDGVLNRDSSRLRCPSFPTMFACIRAVGPIDRDAQRRLWRPESLIVGDSFAALPSSTFDVSGNRGFTFGCGFVVEISLPRPLLVRDAASQPSTNNASMQSPFLQVFDSFPASAEAAPGERELRIRLAHPVHALLLFGLLHFIFRFLCPFLFTWKAMKTEK
ncbi:hypothetical protein AXG93_4360s1190 [Marchantia polymorpha subsp. ruderalis]|uniref:Uncharacterized protein n=1 Tax=Marchantia polymorpha subsp. ruderalis TaxID=1480154 RepID=A0A176W336_MARPO|nr:hypothetical protein AXG93_4360s1190 [Marchantia polymorpha subsp. ruderalis]